MNRAMMRASKKIGRAMMKLPENEFKDVTVEAITQSATARILYPTKVLRNNHYVVQIFAEDRMMFGRVMHKMMIRRNDAEPIREWTSLQKIKTQILGAERVAIQVFPKESELVDVANMYWLFFEGEI